MNNIQKYIKENESVLKLYANPVYGYAPRFTACNLPKPHNTVELSALLCFLFGCETVTIQIPDNHIVFSSGVKREAKISILLNDTTDETFSQSPLGGTKFIIDIYPARDNSLDYSSILRYMFGCVYLSEFVVSNLRSKAPDICKLSHKDLMALIDKRLRNGIYDIGPIIGYQIRATVNPYMVGDAIRLKNWYDGPMRPQFQQELAELQKKIANVRIS